MNWPPLLALLASLGFALGHVFLKRGLQYMRPVTATLVSLSVTGLFIWGLAAVSIPLSVLLTPKVLPFMVAGVVAPGFARLALFVGVDRVGVSRAAPMTATAPLFAVVIAMTVLGERPGALVLVGATCIVGGGALLSARGLTDRAWRRRDLIFPLLAALGFAVRDNITRFGFREFHEPLAAAAMATLTSLFVMWGFAGVQPGWSRLSFNRAGVLVVAFSGLCEGLAYLCMLRALSTGSVSVVSPLINGQPIFVLGLTAIFLRDLERVTWRITVASALMVAGIVLVVLSRSG